MFQVHGTQIRNRFGAFRPVTQSYATGQLRNSRRGPLQHGGLMPVRLPLFGAGGNGEPALFDKAIEGSALDAEQTGARGQVERLGSGWLNAHG